MGDKSIPASVKSLLDIHTRPFVLVDRKFNIVAANKAYADQYNLRPEDVVGRKCHQVSHNSERPCAEHGEDCPHRRMFLSGKVEEAVHLHTRPDGSRECVGIKAHPIMGDDGRIEFMGEELQPIASEDMLTDEALVGSSPKFLEAIHEANLLASVDIPLLIHGESGVGKEQFAAYIHKRSPRAEGPFVTLDCCGLSETLFESELFGHEAGAFTDAHKQKKGLFEVAANGTLFLDEIGEISPALQAKLLRVIETGTFRRVGGTKTLHSDVRILSATNRKLRKLVAAGDFRHDLYFRLAGHTITLPPLRERKQDIPALICFFLQELGKQMAPSAEALAVLDKYNFPGNIRELKYIVELAALKAGDSLHIKPEHLPELLVHWTPSDTSHAAATKPFDDFDDIGADPADAPDPGAPRRASDRYILGMDTRLVIDTLQQVGGSRRLAAKRLGISERKMYRLIRKYKEAGLEVPRPYQP